MLKMISRRGSRSDGADGLRWGYWRGGHTEGRADLWRRPLKFKSPLNNLLIIALCVSFFSAATNYWNLVSQTTLVYYILVLEFSLGDFKCDYGLFYFLVFEFYSFLTLQKEKFDLIWNRAQSCPTVSFRWPWGLLLSAARQGCFLTILVMFHAITHFIVI